MSRDVENGLAEWHKRPRYSSKHRKWPFLGPWLNIYCLLSDLAFEWQRGWWWCSIMPKIPEISVANGKVRFGFFWPKYSGSPLEVVHLFRSEYSNRNALFHFWQTGSFVLIREFGKEMKNGKSHSYWLARFNKKMSFHFRRYSYWPVSGRFGTTCNSLANQIQTYCNCT